MSDQSDINEKALFTFESLENLVGVHTWITSNEGWLRRLFNLEDGIPSLSTLRIIYMLLDPTFLSECFAN